MVVLFIANGINHAANIGIVLHPLNGRADILCHVYRGTIGAQHDLFVQTFVGEIDPYAAIVLLYKTPLFVCPSATTSFPSK